MALIQNILYDGSEPLEFDSDEIEIVNNKASLKLQFKNQTDFSEDFTDDTGFVYDDTKAEFVGGLIRQKDQTPLNSVFAAKFNIDANPVTTEADLNWHKGGSVGATLNGSPIIVSGKLVCQGVHGVGYNADSSAQESHKFKYTPNYSTGPATNVNVLSSRTASSNNNDRFELFNSPSGNNIRVNMYNNTGGLVVSGAIGGWNPTVASEYEFELVIDSTAGIIRVFIDGILLGSLSPGAWARGGVATVFKLGANTAVYNIADGSFDDYIYYTDLQHTSDYTPGYSLIDFIYAESSAILPIFTYSGPGELEPAGPPTSTESGAPKYIIQNRYWAGSSWEISDGSYAQATLKADIVANIATFPDTGLSTITVIVVFGDSNNQSSVDQIDFAVVGQEFAQDNPTIRPETFIQLDGADSVSATFTPVEGPDTVQGILETKTTLLGPSTYYYWDGAAWSTSDGSYAQSSTVEDLADNFASLDLSAGVYGRMVWFLHSDDGTTTPALASHTLNYDFFISFSTPSKCILYGKCIGPDGSPRSGTVSIKNLQPFKYGEQLLLRTEATTNIDAEGYWEIELVETSSVGRAYQVTITYVDDIAEPAIYNIIIPNQDSYNLTSNL